MTDEKDRRVAHIAHLPIHGSGRPGAMGAMLIASAIAASVGIVASPTGRIARRSPPYGGPLTDAVKRAHGIDPDGPLGKALTVDYSDLENRILANMSADEIAAIRFLHGEDVILSTNARALVEERMGEPRFTDMPSDYRQNRRAALEDSDLANVVKPRRKKFRHNRRG